MIPPLTSTLALQFFQVMRLGTAVLTGILLAKSGLSVGEIGAWEMLLYIGTMVTYFWVAGLLQGISSVYSKLEADARKTFIFNHFLLFCGIAILLFLVLWTGESWVTPVLTGMPEVPYFKWFALYLLFNLPAFPVEYIYLLQEKPQKIVWWGILTFGGHLAALGYPVFAGHSLETSLMALVALSAGKWIWAAGMALRYGRVKLDWPMILSYLVFCIPLILSNVVSNFLILTDNWLVGWHFQDQAVYAVYRYGAREFPLATALVSALGTSLIPLLATDQAMGLAQLKAKTLKLMHLLFPVNILLMCLSQILFPLVFNPDFAASASLFNIYLLTLSSRILLPASVVLARSDSKSIFWISLVELLVKVVLGLAFIQWWGLSGLAFSVVLSFWIEKIGLIWILERKHQVKTSQWLDWKWYLGYSCALFLAFWLSQTEGFVALIKNIFTALS